MANNYNVACSSQPSTSSVTSAARAGSDVDSKKPMTTNILTHIKNNMMKSLWKSKFASSFHKLIDDEGYRKAVGGNPLDLDIIRQKLDSCKYTKSTEYLDDVKAMLDGCKQYFGLGSHMYSDAHGLEALFLKKVKTLPQEDEVQQPAAGPGWKARRLVMSSVTSYDDNSNNSNNCGNDNSNTGNNAASSITESNASVSAIAGTDASSSSNTRSRAYIFFSSGSNASTLSITGTNASSLSITGSNASVSFGAGSNTSSLFTTGSNASINSSAGSNASSLFTTGSIASINSSSGSIVSMDDDEACRSYVCPQCTFINKPDVTHCEVCCCSSINQRIIDRSRAISTDTVSRPRERLFGESSMSVTSQISGDNKETMAAEVIELDTDEESWSCVRCTFLNHPLINTCECCLLERSSASEVPEQNPWKELPITWSVPKPGEVCKMTELLPSDPEFMEVERNVRKTSGNISIRIDSITRIENAHLYRLYAVTRDQMNAANGPSVENERLLWHGTAADIVKVICQRGFNRSYCGKNATLYGKGVYFATNFWYSAQDVYSPPDRDNKKHVFQCRVLTGHFHRGKPELVEPPIRDKKTMCLYDSVTNEVKAPVIFVVFHDTQVYPEYLITFHCQ